MLEKARCKNVQATCGDFLETDHADPRFAEATHMYEILILRSLVPCTPPNVRNSLLDPSCSGSGIVNRLDHLGEAGPHSKTMIWASISNADSTENEEEEGQSDRLQKLADFQLSMIKHAMKCE